jgi:hypothetical protein
MKNVYTLEEEQVAHEQPKNGRARYSYKYFTRYFPTICPTNGAARGARLLGVDVKKRKILVKSFGEFEHYFQNPTWIDISMVFRDMCEITINYNSQELKIIDIVEYDSGGYIYWKPILGAAKVIETQAETLF